MMRRLAALTTLCALTVLAAGCGSTPASRFYTLNSPAVPAAGAPSNLSVSVGPVSIPGSVDRPQIVVNTSANQLALDEFNRWASPLQTDIARAVAENLSALLGATRVSQFPQTLSVDADFRVMIEVQRFESTLGESATLDAVWAVRRSKDGKSETGRTKVREPVAQNGYDALVAGHSRAVARMSQDIAEVVRTLSRPGQ
jgi:uncharacterized lipoprotein YmbA